LVRISVASCPHKGKYTHDLAGVAKQLRMLRRRYLDMPTQQTPPGFNFGITNESVLTEHDCGDVACSLEMLVARWAGSGVYVRLEDKHTIGITVTGPLTVERYRMVTQEIEREADRIKAARMEVLKRT
jgi:hypothetical protein